MLNRFATPHLGQGTELFSETDYTRQRAERLNALPGTLTDYDCVDCRNKGLVHFAADGYLTVRECACMPQRRTRKRIAASGLSGLLESCTLDSFQTPERWQADAKRAALSFLGDSSGHWFFAGGQVGCGKTHLCAAIAGELLKSGRDVRYMLWKDDSTRLKAAVNDDSQYGPLIDSFKTASVLYIDDFFKTERGKSPTAGDINVAFELLNFRYNSTGLITIISSERTVDALLEIDEAVGSRIFQRSRKYCLIFGPDKAKNYRLRA